MTEQLDRIEAKLDSLLEIYAKKKRTTVVTAEFRQKMVDEFSVLGDQMEVDHQIDLALAHKSVKNYTDLQLYVKNWLKRAVEFKGWHDPLSANAKRNAINDETDRSKYERDYEERWRE